MIGSEVPLRSCPTITGAIDLYEAYPDITTRTSRYNHSEASISYSLEAWVAKGQSKPHKLMDLITTKLDPSSTRGSQN
jgi:hypothetical protein